LQASVYSARPTGLPDRAISISKVFAAAYSNRGLARDPGAVAAMRQHFSDKELTPARLRMARIPEAAELIDNAISRAPGFMIGNVIVMAGVARIMQVMLDAIPPRLAKGRPMLSRSLMRRKATWRTASQSCNPCIPRCRSAAIRTGRCSRRAVAHRQGALPRGYQ
jgi:hypothetical protein